MNHSEALNRAADIIEDQGWATGDRGTRVEFGPRCALGAISQAVGWRAVPSGNGGEMHYATYLAHEAPPTAVTFARYCMEKQPNPWDEVSNPAVAMSYAWSFNDDAEGAHEVVAELRACALIEAAKAEVKETTTA